MPERDNDKDQPQTPPERTTPYGTPEPGRTTADFQLSTPALRALSERYDLLGELGRGGMGIVYRARDRETDEIVALKILHPDVANRPEVIERFKAELRLARKITHKNVCRTYELLRFGDTVAIAMEYVEGESLREFLTRYGTVPFRKGLEWVAQMCSALAEAHSQGIVHRDLKPENILIARDATVKVMDFGIARSLEADATRTGTLIGTPAYMSPEQAEAKPPDARSDVYSLGHILYEMFTGQRAFQADTPVALALKQIQEMPPPPRDIDPYLPAFLDRAIEKCLEKNPRKRFQSVPELGAALAEKPETGFAVAEAAELPLPVHLTRWQRVDIVFLALSLCGVLLYFGLQEGIFPARKLQFSIGAPVAEKLTENFAERLGTDFEEIEDSSLAFWTWDNFMWRLGRTQTYSALPTWQPFRWRVLARIKGEEKRSIYAVDASTGDFIGYESDFPLLQYEAPIQPARQQLRTKAYALIEDFFAVSPSEVSMNTEDLGKEEGQWTYNLTLTSAHRLPGTQLVYGFQVWAGQLVYFWREHDFIRGLTAGEIRVLSKPEWWRSASPIGIIVLCLLLLMFARGRIAIHWKSSLLIAIPYGLATALIFQEWQPEAFTERFVLHAFLGFIMAASVRELVCRRFPAKSGLLDLLAHWRTHRFVLGIGILRGLLLGFLLLGLLNLLTELGIALRSYWVDPWAVATTAISQTPALHALGNSLTESLELSLLGVVLPLYFFSRWPRLATVIAGFWTALLFNGSLAWLQPWPANFLWLVLLGALLAMFFHKYDATTIFVGIFTLELWFIGFPNLILFGEIDPNPFYMIFIVWLCVILVGGWACTENFLRRAYQRIQGTIG